MRTVLAPAICTGMLLSLAACGQEGASNDQASAQTDTNTSLNQMTMSDPNNPFSQAEMQMHKRMMAVQGANASETWVRKMIEHHRGAVDMSNVIIGLGGDAPVLALARKIVSDQGKEVQELERLLQAGGITTGTSGGADPYDQSDKMMHDRMMAAEGTTPSDTWIRKMIEHHRGAIDMSNILLRLGGDPTVLGLARSTVQKQQREVAMLERMLAGDAEPSSSAATPASEPASKAEPLRAAARPKVKEEPSPAAPRAAPKAAPKEEPKAVTKAAEPPAPTCAPEHRALGHC